MNDDIPDDMTEIYDADVPRVDLVGAAANGVPRFLIAKGQGGLFPPDYVRGLLAKSAPTPEAPRAGETVTMTGSPAAIAALIHGAPVRKAAPAAEPTYEQIIKAKYDADDLKRMADSGAAMPDESYPIADREDLTRAVRAVGRGGADHDEIRRHVIRRAKALGASSEIPDNWASDGSLKKADAAPAPPETTEVAKDMDTDGSAGMPTDDGIDGMDPTVVLAAPDDDAPGDPNDPGSPAWEAIDAATACKWTAILARARTALGIMADREMLEAAAADPSDAESAMDLGDAACAIDYAISVLAPFAVDEQAESDEGAMALEMVGKALAGFDASALDTVESLGALRKAGRVLSSANEAAIRGAVESLQKVLASLPAAPAPEEAGQPVAKTANEEPDMATPTPAEDVTAASGQQPAMGAAGPEPKPVAGAAVTDVAKADKPPQVAVYDAHGNLVGVADPADITMIAAAKAPAANTGDDAPDEPAAPAAETPDAPPTDMTPAPAASVGTPADAVPADDDTVAKAAQPTDTNEAPQDVLKGSDIRELVKAAIDEQGARQGELIKSLEDRNRELEERNEALAKQAAELNERLTKVENQPAVMAIASNGAIPPPHLMRGQGHGATPDMSRAQLLKARLAASDDAIEKKQIADEMQELAIARFQEMQRR